MTSAVSAIALASPLIASNAIFSFRRTKRGLNAIDDNKPVYGAANVVIANGQGLKGIRAAQELSPEFAESASKISNGFNNIAKSSKFFSAAGKVIDFTADNINPIICVTSGLKVLSSDDKTDTLAREMVSLPMMFAFEGAAKSILGMPYMKKIGGKAISVSREALYKKSPYITAQVKAFEDYCSTSKLFNMISLSSVPGLLKGILFVAASITGYSLGQWICNKILGKKSEY